MFLRLLVVALCVHCVTAYRMFQEEIPNGAAVPFPCKSGQVWEGVGHILNEGTGTRNPFGLAFAAAGLTWTVDLCRADSDGDGLTNGDELGDPDCVWKTNAVPARSTGLSHPGICDPWDGLTCSKKIVSALDNMTQAVWMETQCRSGGLDCPAITESGTLVLDLRIPKETRVPAKETTYECMIFNLSEIVDPTTDFHIVAVTPIIDNRNVLHHMVLFGCTDDTQPTSEPFECGMVAAETCFQFMHVWTVGLAGECYHRDCGVRIGPTGYKVVAIQIHWNNPTERSDYIDTSGFHIFYTPILRTYDAGVLMVGDTDFILPSKRQDITIRSTCSDTCTKQLLRAPINITSAWNHMHYSGYSMDIQVHRDGKFLQYLTEDKIYSYDSPTVNLYPDPFVLVQSDAITTTCHFNTMNRNKTTIFGEATQEEMCFGFFTFYPKQNMRDPFCISNLGTMWCDENSFGGCASTSRNALLNALNTTNIYRDVARDCNKFSPCLEQCVDTIVKYMKSDKCLQGNVWDFLQMRLKYGGNYNQEFLSRIASCEAEVYKMMNPQVCPSPTAVVSPDDDSDSAPKTSATTAVVLLSFCVLFAQLWL